MRMWMINPKKMCTRHLLGEHGEIHKHRHVFVKQHSIFGRVYPIVQIEPANMKTRHDLLVEEMIERGISHNSPYEQPNISHLPDWQQNATVNTAISENDLSLRCENCKLLLDNIS